MNEVYEAPPYISRFIFSYEGRRMVTWLEGLRDGAGHYFAPRTLFEVLRQDDDSVNLCEVCPAFTLNPDLQPLYGALGRTIRGVRI